MGLIQDLAAKEIGRRGAQRQALEAIRLKEQRLTAKIPVVWEAIQAAIRQGVTDFNVSFSDPVAFLRESSSFESEIIKDDRVQTVCQVCFSSATDCIEYRLVRRSGPVVSKPPLRTGLFVMDLGATGEVTIFDVESGQHLVSQQVADVLLRAALG